jgi:vacuolar protein sorting-associated protein 26
MELFSSLLSKPPVIKVFFDSEREKYKMKNPKDDWIDYPAYSDTDIIKGKIIIELNKNKNFEHNGIKVELIGMIENYRDKKQNSKFISLTKDLEPSGFLNNEITQLDFEFSGVEKQFETYRGLNIGVKYSLITTLSSKYKNIVNEAEFVILKYKSLGEIEKENSPIKMEIGIEQWLHVSLEIDKSKYYLRDVVTGDVVFKKVSVRLQSMEIEIIKKEVIGSGSS